MNRTSRRSSHEGFIQVRFSLSGSVESCLFLKIQFHQVMWFFFKCKNFLNDKNFRKTFFLGVFHVLFKMESWESWHFSREFWNHFFSWFFFLFLDPLDVEKIVNIFQKNSRVWSWPRMNASNRLNTCKLNAYRDSLWILSMSSERVSNT